MKITTNTGYSISDALTAATDAAIEHKVNYDVVYMDKSKTYVHMPSVPSAKDYGWTVYATVEAP
jgi:hypothetical protein